MNESSNYPLNAVSGAVKSVVGWTLSVTAVTIVGIWIGFSIAPGAGLGPAELGWMILLLPVIWLIAPHILVPYAVTFLSWYLPVYSERLRLRIAALAVNFLTWLTYPTIIHLFGWDRLF
jgi:hypothetical protein